MPVTRLFESLYVFGITKEELPHAQISYNMRCIHFLSCAFLLGVGWDRVHLVRRPQIGLESFFLSDCSFQGLIIMNIGYLLTHSVLKTVGRNDADERSRNREDRKLSVRAVIEVSQRFWRTAARSYKMLVATYQTARCLDPEGHNVNTRRRENLKYIVHCVVRHGP
jgi:hypothetical protein